MYRGQPGRGTADLLHQGLLNERWGGEWFRVGNDRVVCGGYTAILAASQGGSEGLVVELLKRGADRKARNDVGCDSPFIASARGHVTVATILLGKGCDPNTRSDYMTALGIAAAYDHLMHDGRTALQWYGQFADPPLTPVVLDKRSLGSALAVHDGAGVLRLPAHCRPQSRPPRAEPAAADQRQDPSHRHEDQGSAACVSEHEGVWARRHLAHHRLIHLSSRSTTNQVKSSQSRVPRGRVTFGNPCTVRTNQKEQSISHKAFS